MSSDTPLCDRAAIVDQPPLGQVEPPLELVDPIEDFPPASLTATQLEEVAVGPTFTIGVRLDSNLLYYSRSRRKSWVVMVRQDQVIVKFDPTEQKTLRHTIIEFFVAPVH
jgi:hypothetical protein